MKKLKINEQLKHCTAESAAVLARELLCTEVCCSAGAFPEPVPAWERHHRRAAAPLPAGSSRGARSQTQQALEPVLCTVIS